jgi:hypothetical protein
MKKLGWFGAGLGVVGMICALAACTAPAADEDTSAGEDNVTRAGSKPMRFVTTTRLQEGEVTFCLTRHPLDTTVVKLSRCSADANTASDADTFQVVTNDPRRSGVFSFDGTKQMVLNVDTKTLSFAAPGACAGSVACVQGGPEGLTYFDPGKQARRGLAAAMAGAGDGDVASGANNALDAHLRVADRSDLEAQAVTKPMNGLAQRCAIANGVDSCGASGKVCRLESVDHCKERCPLAAGPELWRCWETCERPNAPATPYYERLGYCGPKNIQDKCLDGDPNVVACGGSQVWAGGFDCKTHAQLFRCDDGQTCRSFVYAVDGSGQRKSTEQLKRELCKNR